ncbi:hypothetical protein HC031_16250 [Planosporangium thailandense]|uniref:Motility protein n=1 Tax=Planosporangium thailandense TaxID=765197 RepID=A0ABX0XYW5_9ACTN|nr:hypothetical protein [Planosporangium thailandense]NJC71252.1 hypothetical protein [Planosporangium thailandense]
MSVDAVSGSQNPIVMLTQLAVATQTLKLAQQSASPALELIEKATENVAATGRVDTYA